MRNDRGIGRHRNVLVNGTVQRGGPMAAAKPVLHQRIIRMKVSHSRGTTRLAFTRPSGSAATKSRR